MGLSLIIRLQASRFRRSHLLEPMHCPLENHPVESGKPAAGCKPANCRVSCGRDILADLLAEESLADIPGVCDVVLDFKWAIGASAQNLDARHLVEAFLLLRERLENRFYLSVYRLRHWLENHVCVECSLAGGERLLRLPLDARFRKLEQIERRARQDYYENELGADAIAAIEIRLRLLPSAAKVAV